MSFFCMILTLPDAKQSVLFFLDRYNYFFWSYLSTCLLLLSSFMLFCAMTDCESEVFSLPLCDSKCERHSGKTVFFENTH